MSWKCGLTTNIVCRAANEAHLMYGLSDIMLHVNGKMTACKLWCLHGCRMLCMMVWQERMTDRFLAELPEGPDGHLACRVAGDHASARYRSQRSSCISCSVACHLGIPAGPSWQTGPSGPGESDQLCHHQHLHDTSDFQLVGLVSWVSCNLKVHLYL